MVSILEPIPCENILSYKFPKLHLEVAGVGFAKISSVYYLYLFFKWFVKLYLAKWVFTNPLFFDLKISIGLHLFQDYEMEKMMFLLSRDF